MAQTARPASDVTTDSWTTAPLFSKVNDASDATFITSPAASTQCEVALDSLTDPVSSTGHILRVRALAAGSAAGEKLTFYLYEGATLRAASAAETVSRSTITEYSYTLTGTEADTLSDYADLRVRLARTTGGAGETISVYDVWMEVPDAPVTDRRGYLSFAEVEVPTAPRRGWLSFAEMETANAPRRGFVSFSEFEVPTAPRRGYLSFAEMEAPAAPRMGYLSFAEFELPGGGRRGYLSFAELEVPSPPVGGRPPSMALLGVG